QHFEHRIFIDHSTNNCTSDALYKGALQGQGARTVWVGDVLIRGNTQGTDSFEKNENLLLTEGAQADSIPNLEIETGIIDSGGHASSVGRFDEHQLFYLMARGIPEPLARKLIVRGFLNEIIQRIVIEDVDQAVTDVMEQESSGLELYPPLTAIINSPPSSGQHGDLATMSTLEIKDLHVSIATEQVEVEILKGVTLTINSGETHAIMGPNGSGKSTLAQAISGHPSYHVTGGQILLDGEDVLEMEVDERAQAGLFLAMQYPVEVPGVSMSNFLRSAKTALDGEAPQIRTWTKEVRSAMENLEMGSAFATRNVNEGFSGGEKKRAEILQLELFKPKFAILDETDSGLDIDALRIVSAGVNRAQENNNMGTILCTY